MTLLQRIESANEPRRELFEEAGQLLHGPYRTNWSGRNFYCFTAMLDAQAWTSAAEMLVPDGREWKVERWDTNGVYPPHVLATAWISGASRCFAAHPSLALLAAILRAERKDDE